MQERECLLLISVFCTHQVQREYTYTIGFKWSLNEVWVSFCREQWSGDNTAPEVKDSG